jgi:hypothetical protein
MNVFNELKGERDAATAMYKFLLSIINETYTELENVSEDNKEVISFRLNYLEEQLTSLRNEYAIY